MARKFEDRKRLFFEKAKAKWGDRFDYSKAEYVDAFTPILITCKNHGDFMQAPYHHLRGGCSQCNGVTFYTTKSFVEKCSKIHNNKYSYKKTIFVDTRSKVCITCPIHGDFYQVANSHLRGGGCPKCGSINCGNSALERREKQFIDRSIKIHGLKYDYSSVKYVDKITPVSIICPVHGVFLMKPRDHVNGCGCIKCGSKLDDRRREFIKRSIEVHGSKYDYSKVEYINNSTPVRIVCPEHGEFLQKPNSHTMGHGCRVCANKVLSSSKSKEKDQWISGFSMIHNNMYDYSLVENVSSEIKIPIKCPIHGIFYQKANSHLYGSGCPECGLKRSKSEGLLFDFVSGLIEAKKRVRGVCGVNLEIDVYVESLSIGIEYDGLYWHSDKHRNKYNILNKTTLFKDKGIKIIHVFEDEWLMKSDIVKSRVANILGMTKNKMYARKLEIRDVGRREANIFLNKNHLQGECSSSVRIGLYFEDELVSIMTFSKPRLALGQKKEEGVYEMARFCSVLDTSVIGGASKLFKYFIDNYSPKKVVSFADRRWSDGELYRALGFDFVKETAPNYYYVKGNKRYNRFNFRKDVLVKEGYDPNMSEKEIMSMRGFFRLYDCGMLKFEYKCRC